MNVRWLSAVATVSYVLLAAGCMTSRGICRVEASGEVRRAATVNRYRITQIQERLPDGRLVCVHSNRRMRDMLDDAADLDELTSYTPGVWAQDGIPVTVTFVQWRNSFAIDWTIIPCVLTLGICPYCHHEEISARVEVSRDDGLGSATFAYSECDDWKMSMLFALGHIPYSDPPLARNEFMESGRGDVLYRAHRDGLAHGLAAALAGMEQKIVPITTK